MSAALELFLARLPKEEGERFDFYDDKTGKTVHAPVGTLTFGRGYTAAIFSRALFDGMDRAIASDIEARIVGFPWFTGPGATPARQSVFLDIAYNEGVHGLLNFPHMLSAARANSSVTSSTDRWFWYGNHRAAESPSPVTATTASSGSRRLSTADSMPRCRIARSSPDSCTGGHP